LVLNNLGNQSVFEQAVLPHLDAAYNLARWLTRNDHDAEDVAQEACLRAMKFFDGFHGRLNPPVAAHHRSEYIPDLAAEEQGQRDGAIGR